MKVLQQENCIAPLGNVHTGTGTSTHALGLKMPVSAQLICTHSATPTKMLTLFN